MGPDLSTLERCPPDRMFNYKRTREIRFEPADIIDFRLTEVKAVTCFLWEWYGIICVVVRRPIQGFLVVGICFF